MKVNRAIGHFLKRSPATFRFNIIDANRLNRKEFGTNLGCKCYEVFKHRSEECYPCCVRQTFHDGQMRIHEDIAISAKGESINVLVHTAPLFDSSGRIKHVIEMSANITQIRRLQSQLTSIGMLISSISHGIKGLLNGLNGGIYLVNNGLAKDNPARLKQGWEIVLRNVSRIRSMVLDILYYTKDREPDYAQIQADTLIEDVYSVIHDKAVDLKIEVVKETDEQAGVFEADVKAITALLVNLAENSIDACRIDSHKNNHVIKLKSTGSQNSVLFAIEDNGIGMDRETREKVFTLFFSSKGNEGTGLGLFIANKIANAHGGAINVESQPGVGTRFLIDLPRVRPEPKVPAPTTDSAKPKSCETATVVPPEQANGFDPIRYL